MSPTTDHDPAPIAGGDCGPADRLRLVGEALAASATTGVRLADFARELGRVVAAHRTSTAALREHLRRHGLPVVTIATVPTPTGTECRRAVRGLGGWSL